MTDDLPTRLLEALERRERVAHLTDADHERRLCQAHREIVEVWRTSRNEYEVAAEHRARFVGTEQEFDRLDEAVGVAVERLQVMEQVLKRLASGYGLEV